MSSNNGPSILPYNLHVHQIQDVAWIHEQEADPQFVGGFNMNETGLGKTRETLAAINSNTLIICPSSVIDVWAKEAVDMSFRGKVIVYDGSKRVLRQSHLMSSSDQCTIVIASYSTLCSEARNNPTLPKHVIKQLTKQPTVPVAKRTRRSIANNVQTSTTTTTTTTTTAPPDDPVVNLLEYQWPRVILDESQIIRNRQTSIFKMVTKLNARFRWCITATPILNHFEEFYAQIIFLRIEPWWKNVTQWRRDVVVPLERGQLHNEKLQKLILRRTKDQVLTWLPPMTIHKIQLDLSAEERLVYDYIYAIGQKRSRHLISLMNGIDELMKTHKEREESKRKQEKRMWGGIEKYIKKQPSRKTREANSDRQHWTAIRLRCQSDLNRMMLRLRQLVVCPQIVLDEELNGGLKRRKSNKASAAKRKRSRSAYESDNETDNDNDNDDEDNHFSDAELSESDNESSDRHTTSTTRTTTTTSTTNATNETMMVQLGSLLVRLEEQVNESECPICFENKADRIAEPCLHECCEGCWLTLANNYSDEQQNSTAIAKCPFCRCPVQAFHQRTIAKTKIQESIDILKMINNPAIETTVATHQQPTSDQDKQTWDPVASTKFKYFVQQILSHNEPFLVVSQWTSVLDKFQEFYLSHGGEQMMRLDGKMTRIEQDTVKNRYQTEAGAPRGMLVSLLSSSSVGVTLHRATRVYILDPWWNPAQEHQMINRAHRIGQTKPVHVYQVTMRNTIEDAVLEMRQKKQKHANLIEPIGNGKIRFRNSPSSRIADISTRITLVFHLNQSNQYRPQHFM